MGIFVFLGVVEGRKIFFLMFIFLENVLLLFFFNLFEKKERKKKKKKREREKEKEKERESDIKFLLMDIESFRGYVVFLYFLFLVNIRF